MLNLSDKEIDRLSREAADSYEPDDSSLSWSRLEQKLAQQMPERPPDGFRFGRINPYVWGPAIILLAGASFFFIKNVIYSQHSTRNIQTIDHSVSMRDADSKNASGNTIRLDSTSAVQRAAEDIDGHSSATDQNPAVSAKSGSDANAGKLSGSVASKNLYANPNAGSGNNQTATKHSASKAIKSGAAIAAGSIETNRAISGEEQKNTEMNGMAGTTGAGEMARRKLKTSPIYRLSLHVEPRLVRYREMIL